MYNSLVPLGLASHTRANAGKSLPAPIRNAVAAILALLAAFAGRHAGPSGSDGVIDRIFDLVLHRAIS